MSLNRCLDEKRWDELRRALGTGWGSDFQPATGAITAYTAENTVALLIWRLEPIEIVFHSVPVRTEGEQESCYHIVAHMCYGWGKHRCEGGPFNVDGVRGLFRGGSSQPFREEQGGVSRVRLL